MIKNLETGRLSWIICMLPKHNYKCSCKRETGSFDIKNDGHSVTAGEEIEAMQKAGGRRWEEAQTRTVTLIEASQRRR